MRRVEQSQGFALLLTLWMTLLIALIAASVMRQLQSDSVAESAELLRFKLILSADAAINRTILSLSNPSDTVRYRIDGTPKNITLNGQVVTVRVLSQLGLIDLNSASTNLLVGVLQVAGLSSADSGVLASRVVSWRSEEAAGGDNDTYSSAGRSYRPRHAPFRSIGELRLVLGMTDDLQSRIAPLFTVYSGSPNVDLSVASVAELQVLAGSGNGFAASQLAAKLAGNAAGVDRGVTPGEAVCINAYAERESFIVLRSACVRLQIANDQTYEILSWQ